MIIASKARAASRAREDDLQRPAAGDQTAPRPAVAIDFSDPGIRAMSISRLALLLAGAEKVLVIDAAGGENGAIGRAPRRPVVSRPRCLLAAAAAATAMVTPTASLASCGAAFCTMNTDWNVQGVFTEPGGRMELRYEYLKQDQLREGSRTVSAPSVPGEHQELSTRNQSIFATFDYNFGSGWGLTGIIPVVKRDHSHIDNDSGNLEQWNFTALGDIRIAGRYQRPVTSGDAGQARIIGVLGGLTLPTGKTDETNADGEIAERSLQPGTGTTGAVLGAFYQSMSLHSRWSWFAQAAYGFPLNSHDGFQPGQRATLDVGGRYDATPTVALLLQLNALWRGRDKGDQAEPEDSGGKYLFLSPGVSVMVARGVQLFAIAQLPLYQYVNGAQLTAVWGATAGIGVRF